MAIVNEGNVGIIREMYRLSCEELGSLIGVSGRFISFVERGARKLPEVRAQMIERELDLTPEKLALIYDIYQATQVSTKT